MLALGVGAGKLKMGCVIRRFPFQVDMNEEYHGLRRSSNQGLANFQAEKLELLESECQIHENCYVQGLKIKLCENVLYFMDFDTQRQDKN